MPARTTGRRRERAALFAAAMLAAVGGLVYELILGTAASYLIGDSVLSFSLATGITLFGMGIGSLLAPHLRAASATAFAVNEILLGLIGGNSVLVLYTVFARSDAYWLVFGLVSLVIGVLIGLEIPLLVRTFQQFGRDSSVSLLSQVLAIDYFGSLAASLVFPLVLLPHLGLLRGTYLVGALNVLVAMVVLLQVRAPRRVVAAGVVTALVLTGQFLASSRIEEGIDAATYGDPVIYQEQTPYQKIVLTQYKEDTRLYLGGQLQFSSLDEDRYHEVLAGTALTSVPEPRSVLVLGGGDGMLAREVLAYPSVEHVTLVDIDAAVTTLASTSPVLTRLNEGSLSDPRVTVRNEDAFTYVGETDQRYDAVLVDLVDPSNEKLAKLYSTEFYQRVAGVLAPGGLMVTQATSTFFSPHAFATVAASVAAGMPGATVLPYGVNVPSFGEWGFVMATRSPGDVLAGHLPEGQSYVDEEMLRYLVVEHPVRVADDDGPAQPSTLLHPRVVTTYNDDMRQWRYY